MFSISCSSSRKVAKEHKKHQLTKLCNEMLKFNVWLTKIYKKKRRRRRRKEKCTKKMENHGKVFDRNNKKYFTTNAMK